jgi:AcrR family transcriptional regulator
LIAVAASPRPRRAPRPPWKGPERERRRHTLSVEAIVDAALQVVDTEGFDALTMRRVAQALGTGGASLYAHVDGKDALIELVMDRVIGELEVPWPPDPERWTEQIKECVRGMRAVFAGHRDIARGALARIPTGPHAMEKMERMLALMRAGNLPDQAVAFAADLLSLYATAVAYEDSLYRSRGWNEEDMVSYIGELHDYFANLPAERFPHTVALAATLTSGDGDERFEFGLDMLLRGLSSLRSESDSDAR